MMLSRYKEGFLNFLCWKYFPLIVSLAKTAVSYSLLSRLTGICHEVTLSILLKLLVILVNAEIVSLAS